MLFKQSKFDNVFYIVQKYTIIIRVLLMSVLRALFKNSIKRNFILKIQIVSLVNAMIT